MPCFSLAETCHKQIIEISFAKTDGVNMLSYATPPINMPCAAYKIVQHCFPHVCVRACVRERERERERRERERERPHTLTLKVQVCSGGEARGDGT
jgi:hypothetical protein